MKKISNKIKALLRVLLEEAKKLFKELKRMDRRKRIALIVAAAVLVLLAAGAGVLHAVLDVGKEEPETNESFEDVIDDDPEIDEEIQIDMLRELRASGDLYTALKDWAANTTEHALMQSRDVINILILGVDASGGNSDAIILASVDKANKKIHLSSIMRDSYTYVEAPTGGVAAKINAAYGNGGADCIVSTVENDYKIKIDHYISVNFKTFVRVVDLIGGVRVPVQQYEMRGINALAYDEGRTPLTEYGENVLLTGEQALLYCRVRKCDVDGDISRTRRQRRFISALVEQAGNLTAGDLPELVETAHKYVRTDCTPSALLGLSTQALTQKWYDYEIVQNTYPLPENRMDYAGRQWIWVVDYPADAVALQTAVYGKTNITLSEDRVSAMDIVRSNGVG